MKGVVIEINERGMRLFFNKTEKVRLGNVLINGVIEGGIDYVAEGEQGGIIADVVFDDNKPYPLDWKEIETYRGKKERIKLEKEYVEKMIEYWTIRKKIRMIAIGDRVEVEYKELEEETALKNWKERLKQLEEEEKEVEE